MSFMPVIVFKMLRFKPSVLFGIHTLLDNLIVLQLPKHQSNSTKNG